MRQRPNGQFTLVTDFRASCFMTQKFCYCDGSVNWKIAVVRQKLCDCLIFRNAGKKDSCVKWFVSLFQSQNIFVTASTVFFPAFRKMRQSQSFWRTAAIFQFTLPSQSQHFCDMKHDARKSVTSVNWL